MADWDQEDSLCFLQPAVMFVAQLKTMIRSGFATLAAAQHMCVCVSHLLVGACDGIALLSRKFVQLGHPSS